MRWGPARAGRSSRRAQVLVRAALALLATASAGGQEPAPSATRVELRVEPVVDLYFHARSLASERDAVVPAAYQEAVVALQALGAKLGGGFLAWAVVDRQALGVVTLDDLAARFDVVPPLHTRDGGRLPISEELRAAVAGLRAAEAFHRVEMWPMHWRLIEPARRRLETSLLPVQPGAFAYMLQSLGMRDPGKTIPVYLAAHLPWPGGFTYGLGEGGGVCFVGVGRPEFAGTGLAELVLHEATHALDVESEESVLQQLRSRLEAEGITREDRAWRDLPHTLMFAQAGETIRRFVAADHVHYGDGTSATRAYYDNVPLARFVRDLWVRHLAGEVGLAETIEQLVARAKAERGR